MCRVLLSRHWESVPFKGHRIFVSSTVFATPYIYLQQSNYINIYEAMSAFYLWGLREKIKMAMDRELTSCRHEREETRQTETERNNNKRRKTSLLSARIPKRRRYSYLQFLRETLRSPPGRNNNNNDNNNSNNNNNTGQVSKRNNSSVKTGSSRAKDNSISITFCLYNRALFYFFFGWSSGSWSSSVVCLRDGIFMVLWAIIVLLGGKSILHI